MKQIVQASRQRFWDWRAACNFCFGGTGSGLILAAGLGWALGTPSPFAVMTALVFIGFGLTMVWLEIGRPWRAINVMFHPQTSWMTRESIVAPLLFASGVATVAIDFRFVVVTAVLAAGFLYCQARMLQASRGIPAWCQKESVPLIVTTGLAEGAGAYLIIADSPKAVIAVALFVSLAREVAREAYRRNLVEANPPGGTLAWLSGRDEKILIAVRLVAVALFALAIVGYETAALGGALGWFGGWGLKFGLINRAAFTRGQSISHTPMRGRGSSDIVTASRSA